MSYMDAFIAPYPLERHPVIIKWPPTITLTIKKHDMTLEIAE